MDSPSEVEILDFFSEKKEAPAEKKEITVLFRRVYEFVDEWYFFPVKQAKLYLLWQICYETYNIMREERAGTHPMNECAFSFRKNETVCAECEDNIALATENAMMLFLGPGEDFGVRSGAILDGICDSHLNAQLNKILRKDWWHIKAYFDEIGEVENPYAD